MTPRPSPDRARARTGAIAPVLVAALLFLLPGAASAQEAGIGGGSDVTAGAVIELPRGATIPPVHHVFADNPETQPIEVEFRASAPRGITITPERERFSIPPGESVKDPFSIAVADTVAPGDHDVSVQLVRTDVEARPGSVTHVPAVGTTFVVRVPGEAGSVRVAAVGAESGRPVHGTLALSAVTGNGALFEVDRAEGSELDARVAPGTYRAAYLLAGRELAAGEVDVAAGERAELTLEVRTISFVTLVARPVEEDGRVVVAALVASVENHLEALAGPVTIQAVVERDGRRVDTVVLEKYEELPAGVTEATSTYRPEGGFADGAYEVRFELVAPEFVLRAPEAARFEAGGDRFPVGAAVGAGAAVVVAVAAALRFRRARRRAARRARRAARL